VERFRWTAAIAAPVLAFTLAACGAVDDMAATPSTAVVATSMSTTTPARTSASTIVVTPRAEVKAEAVVATLPAPTTTVAPAPTTTAPAPPTTNPTLFVAAAGPPESATATTARPRTTAPPATAPPATAPAVTSPPATAPPTTAAAPAPAVRVDAAAAADLAARTNSVRTGLSLAPLARNGSIDAMATAWARELASSVSLRHSAYPQQLVDTGFGAAAENVGWASSVAAVHDALVASSGHYNNIVGPYTQIGVGAAYSADGRLWVVELFAA
jgi:uncharacterized protein YkwD